MRRGFLNEQKPVEKSKQRGQAIVAHRPDPDPGIQPKWPPDVHEQFTQALTSGLKGFAAAIVIALLLETASNPQGGFQLASTVRNVGNWGRFAGIYLVSWHTRFAGFIPSSFRRLVEVLDQIAGENQMQHVITDASFDKVEKCSHRQTYEQAC